MIRRRSSISLYVVTIFCGVHLACGQKGPPLAPIVLLPRPVTEVVAKRIENDIVLQFTIPTLNTDGSGPADLRKVEVYAHTGPLPAPADFLKYGSLVASVEVKQPPPPEKQKPQGDAQETPQDETAAKEEAAPSPQDSKPGLIEQGSTTTVRETLTAKHREIGPMPPTRALEVPTTETPVVVERIETTGTVNFELAPQRYYAIFPVSDSRNRRGPVAGPIQVALLEPLQPPEKVDFGYTAEAITLSWPAQPEDALSATGAPLGAPGATAAVAPSAASNAPNASPNVPSAPMLDRETAGTIEFFSDTETEGTRDVLVAVTRAPAPGAKPKPTPALPAQPPAKPRYGYNVYEVPTASAAPGSAPSAPGGASDAPTAPGNVPTRSLNTALLTTPAFTDPRVEFGVERCYVVRRVEVAGTVAIESAPSAPACVSPIDKFPPAPPKSLAHIGGGNGVSLLWEANTESDLGGYLVLRGEAPGDKLSPLTPEPIADTSFLDTTVRRGRTYVYRVVAVDRSTPPNQSAPSEPVEETIR